MITRWFAPAFAELIDATDDLEVGGEAGTAASALKLAITEDFDVVMLYISLPDASVVETVTMLRRRRPDMPILIVSMHAEQTVCRQSAPCGSERVLFESR